MKAAVTGASGFLGANLVRSLCAGGHEVVALARSDAAAAALEALGAAPRRGDVRQLDGLAEAFRGADVVFHLAALFNHPEAGWEDYRAVNVGGALNVAEAARRAGVDRLVHCSTVGVAISGPPPYGETAAYAPPAWDKYETTKAEGERVVLDYQREHGLPVAVVRPSQVYGPGDRSKLKFYRLVKKRVMVNPGRTLKHLIFVDDLSRAFELAASSDKAAGEVFIIADPQPTPLRELVRIAANELGVAPPRAVLPAAPITWLCAATEAVCNRLGVKPPLYRRSMDFFTRSVEFDVAKAKTLLGFESRVDVQTGVARTISWYREQGLL